MRGLLALASALFGATTVRGTPRDPRRTRSPPSRPGLGTLGSLAWIYGASALPFFFSGSVITLAITAWAREISRLYLFDLGRCRRRLPAARAHARRSSARSTPCCWSRCWPSLAGWLLSRRTWLLPLLGLAALLLACEPRHRLDRAPRVQGALRGGGPLLALELVLARHGDGDGGPRPEADLHRLRRRHRPLPRRHRPRAAPRARATASRGSPTTLGGREKVLDHRPRGRAGRHRGPPPRGPRRHRGRGQPARGPGRDELRAVPRLLGPALPAAGRAPGGGRGPQLPASLARALRPDRRHHGRHLGGHRRRRLRPEREQPLHRRGLRRLPGAARRRTGS